VITMFAPNERARRIVITLLAFLLAAAFAVAASATPAHADDPKEFNAFVGDLGVAPADQEFVIIDALAPGLTVTFENPIFNTQTQKAGSFSIEFPSEFDSPTPGAITFHPASGTQNWTAAVEGNKVIIFANTGGDRISVSEAVSVDVTFNAADEGLFALSETDLDGDQQAGGNFGGEGNTFTLANNPPTIIVGEATACEAGVGGAEGQACRATLAGNTNDSGTAACPPEDDGGCGKDGFVLVEFLGSNEDCDGTTCSLWSVDTDTGTGGQNFFYLVVDTGGVKNPTIFAEQFDSGGNSTGEIAIARNCQPPRRVFGCVDIKHPDYSKKAGIYPIRFPATDPRGGYR